MQINTPSCVPIDDGPAPAAESNCDGEKNCRRACPTCRHVAAGESLRSRRQLAKQDTAETMAQVATCPTHQYTCMRLGHPARGARIGLPSGWTSAVRSGAAVGRRQDHTKKKRNRRRRRFVVKIRHVPCRYLLYPCRPRQLPPLVP